MLFQGVIEDCEKDNFTKHTSIAQVIDNAARFVLDENSTAAMTHLSMQRPSNIIDASQFIRLPSSTTWIEYLDPVRRRVWKDEGLALREDPMLDFPIWNGVLICHTRDYPHLYDPEKPNAIFFQSFWQFSKSVIASFKKRRGSVDGISSDLFSTSPCIIILDPDFPLAKNTDQTFDFDSPLTAGYLIRKNIKEREAFERIYSNTRLYISPFASQGCLDHITSASRNRIKALTEDVSQEVMFVLATLLLLNTKNFGERIPTSFERLNKKRIKNGKATLRSYTEIKFRIPKGNLGFGSTAAKTAHWCRGHYKQRKTGLFWWNPHMRGITGGKNTPSPPGGKTYVVR